MKAANMLHTMREEQRQDLLQGHHHPIAPLEVDEVSGHATKHGGEPKDLPDR